MKPSLKIWFSLLDRQVTQLKKLGGLSDPPLTEQDRKVLGKIEPCKVVSNHSATESAENPTPQIRLVLENLLTHIKLGWALFQENPPVQNPITNPMSPAVFNVAATIASEAKQIDDLRRAEFERGATELIENQRLRDLMASDESKPWWSRETKFKDFAEHARNVIGRAAAKQAIRLSHSHSLDAHYEALATMIGVSVSHKSKFSGPNANKNFTVAVAGLLEVDFSQVEKQHGGLSLLLANVERKLKLIS